MIYECIFVGLVYHIDAIQCYQCFAGYTATGTYAPTEGSNDYCGLIKDEVAKHVHKQNCPSNLDICIVSFIDIYLLMFKCLLTQ